MIFVTVGTHTAGFARLVGAVDAWAAGRDEHVTMQIGSTQLEPSHCEWFRFAAPEEIARLIRAARLVVTHAGAGTLLDAVEAGASVIVVPRRAALGEHVDDHQLELAAALDAAGLARMVADVGELDAVLGPALPVGRPSSAPRAALVASIASTLAAWDVGR